MTAPDPLAVRCPYCGAFVGLPCIDRRFDSFTLTARPHPTRIRAAEAKAKEAK